MASPERRIPPAQTSYSYTWRIIGRGSTIPPETAMKLVQDDPHSVFPFKIQANTTDARLKIQEGARCILRPLIIRPEPVEIVNVTPTSFTFRTLPGHFRGQGATICFRTLVNTRGRLCVQQTAEFEKKWRNCILDIGSIALWSIQAAKLAYRLHRYANITQDATSTDHNPSSHS